MDILIIDDLYTDMNDAALSARQGMLIGERLDAIEATLANLSFEVAAESDIDALFE